MEKFKNKDLQKHLKGLLVNPFPITKGTLGGYSIETQEDGGFKSYIYYDNLEDRDEDFNKLEELISIYVSIE